MPSIPALPAAAPSFAERLSLESRPVTASSQLHAVQRLDISPIEGPMDSPLKQVRDDLDRPLAPPLPLVLRPPLRKKKSFARVSSWLFPGAEHVRDGSLGSVTNAPQPITGRDGFYQSVTSPHATGRDSLDSTSSPSSWETEEEVQTAPTTAWSPGSSPVVKQYTPEAQTPPIDRTHTFGRAKTGERISPSVGVAF
jgi:hypothetical protein